VVSGSMSGNVCRIDLPLGVALGLELHFELWLSVNTLRDPQSHDIEAYF
jgi:hypothetical protein